MASTPIVKVDTAVMQATAKKLQFHQGELSRHLSDLARVQDEFKRAVQGLTGNAIQGVFENAQRAGSGINSYLQDIANALQAAGVSYDANAQEAAGNLAAAQLDAATNADGLHAVENSLIDNGSW